MHGASAAQRLAAAELGAGHAEHVAQHPQQRGVAVNIDLMGCAVDLQRESHCCLSVAGADRAQPADLNRAAPAACSNGRSEEHTSELQSLMRHSYAVFCFKNNNT